ncbi:MAG TPA: DUF4375 domain-containing protein [Acidobacteriaceae bacterium]|jgi:hypothetical protein|nr:DUF4375 domain-containing protein [Acidobacteriaceae bacterium]
MTPEQNCTACGGPIDARFARILKGVCGKCKIKQIEADPLFQLLKSLSDRVRQSPMGIATLSESERNYYVVTVFLNQVLNGGFHQFFYNDSGSLCKAVEQALEALGETSILNILRKARDTAFPGTLVLQDIEVRRDSLPFVEDANDAPESVKLLRQLNSEFYKFSEDLSLRLQSYARNNGLITENLS